MAMYFRIQENNIFPVIPILLDIVYILIEYFCGFDVFTNVTESATFNMVSIRFYYVVI